MKIDFEFNHEYGTYRDALYVPDDHTFTDAELEAMKQARYDSWVALITAVPDTPEEVAPPAAALTVAGEQYTLLEGTPSSGAKLLEINGAWYVKA